MKRGISVIAVLVLMIGILLPDSAASAATEQSNVLITAGNETSYRAYLSKLDASLQGTELTVPLDASHITVSGGVQMTDGGVRFCEEESSIEIAVNCETGGVYMIELGYIPDTESNFTDSKVGIKLGGEYPFDEARELTLSWRWRGGEITTDPRGNEILGSMTAIEEETVSSLLDPSGRQAEPLKFCFPKGESRITLISHTGNFTLTGMRLYSEEPAVTYEEKKAEYAAAETDGEAILLEAEDYSEASSTTLAPDYDKSSADTSPNDARLLLYNYIPGTKYTASGQWLEWSFVPEKTGLYKISMRARQNTKSGFSVTRRLYINGEVPFEECGEIKFDYAGDWYAMTLGGEEEYSFYFEEGKSYTLRLEVTPGSLSEVTNRVDDAVYELNSLYRSVVMVVGNDPDKYRDYRLASVIPEFTETVKGLHGELRSIVEALEEINSGRSGSTLSSFHSLINRLSKIEEDPDLLARTLSSFKSDIQGLSSWNQDAKEQPLDLDWISIHPAGTDAVESKAGFFGQLWFDIKRIIYSFAEDYGVVGEIYDEDSSLEVWMSAGRDQMNIVKKLVDNSFSKQYGINVNISLVTVDIRSAILAGTAPDLSLFLSGDMPVNLAVRGSVVNLKEFENFDEVSGRFEEHSVKPFCYKDGVYALPLSETFNMMFVRTDVFDELELGVPNTWEEFYETATILQRNNLEVGIPSNIGMFATLLMQNGGSFYNDTLTGTAFDSDAAITAFDTWTGLFAQYGFPLTYDFYNRFSSGEMPLAITNYTEYLRLEAASPELSGRWEMCLIPGVEKENGEIDRTLSISGATGSDTSPGLSQSVSSAAIFELSEHRQEAWEFLSWFTSDEIQSRYGREIEDALGSISRYTSANMNAFKTLPWSIEERNLLEEQRSRIVALNEISGNYSVTRELISAFRKVVYENANATDTIYTYNKKINKELERKN